MKYCYEVSEGDVIAIDGKILRGTSNSDKRCGVIHMVSALNAGNQVVLGLVKTADKSNEIKVISKLLDMLFLRGCLVMIDSMGCQHSIAKLMMGRKGDYLMSVKDNQLSLYR